MKRGSKKYNGCVSFPVDSKEYVSTGEGGMIVQLVVMDESKEGWHMCCGGGCYVMHGEALTGMTGRHRPDRHFPKLRDKDVDDLYEQFMSIPYLACVDLGSTGWSGYSDQNGEYWKCGYPDLTNVGQELYNLMQKLYPEGTVYLLTWLDT